MNADERKQTGTNKRCRICRCVSVLTVIAGWLVLVVGVAESQTNGIIDRVEDSGRRRETLGARTDAGADKLPFILADRYRAALKRREGGLVSEGDIIWLPLLRDEIARFEKERTLPAQVNTALDAETQDIQRMVLKAKDSVDAERNRREALLEKLRAGKQTETNKTTISPVSSRSGMAVVARAGDAERLPLVERVKITRSRAKIAPMSGESNFWTTVPVALEAGDVVLLKAEGAWKAVGTDVACGPDGHADRPVSDSRVTGAGYGALLFRVGENGLPGCVGKNLCFTNDTPGSLAFDINVPPDRCLRSGCSGAMNVEIEVRRKQ